MSESAFLTSSHTFVNTLLNLDSEVNATISGKDKSADQIYRIYVDRLSLYEKSSVLPLNEKDKLLLQNKKEDLYIELKLFKLKQEIKKQINSIHTELEDLHKNL
jgi:hypothetical protein